ncbi:MAG TPA: hypothetical protein VEC06_17445 [Paucimonas sp.]|nr:hypothetical protein [Paucimonas sp.]
MTKRLLREAFFLWGFKFAVPASSDCFDNNNRPVNPRDAATQCDESR